MRHLLRLPDSLDIIRVLAVPCNWTKASHESSRSRLFDASYLDIPDHLKANEAFMEEFRALMEGAKDLAYVTGGTPVHDSSESGSYIQRYKLQCDKEKRKVKVAKAVSAYDSVSTALDDNVRRAIA
ncbi:hypothetical protein, partial [Sansalvadorimonas verongulae]|uniref:hypothetical protein n=1 Tax=Sansalvadorimonas verongulae TaxID=2172824 RepID=UPI0012BD2D6E